MRRGGVRRLCAVSVDVDPLSCYFRIHGLAPPPQAGSGEVVVSRALPRFVELFERHRIPATFFLVGQSLDEAAGAAAAADLARRGFELGNHSNTHPYEMARLARSDVEREIRDAHEKITRAAKAGGGQPPCGFRAPGYEISSDMLGVLVELGYRYDSSVFPSPPYYAAKAAVMLRMAATGRGSGSVLGDPRLTSAPNVPYRPDMRVPWRRGSAPLLELPIAVTPLVRIPLIGTSLSLLPGFARDRLVGWAARHYQFFNLELHGIDLADPTSDGIPAPLLERQPDLRRPLAERWRALEATLCALALEYEFALLGDAAGELLRDRAFS